MRLNNVHRRKREMGLLSLGGCGSYEKENGCADEGNSVTNIIND